MIVGMAPRGIHPSMDGKKKDDREELVSKKIRAESSKEEELIMQVYNLGEVRGRWGKINPSIFDN